MNKEVLDEIYCKLYLSDFKCDYSGCRCLSLVEVYGEGSWSYLCMFHFISERIWTDKNIGYCLADWIFHLPFISFFWNAWCRNSWKDKKKDMIFTTVEVSTKYIPLR